MSNKTTYYCPQTQEPVDVDPEMIAWDDDGTAVIDCPVHYRTPQLHEIQIAKPVSQGFGGSDA